MTKRQLIDEITTLNPTAAPAFLSGFRDEDLAEYLTHLRWVVPPNVIVEQASGAPADRSPAGDPLPVSESGAASACLGPVSAADAPAVAAAVRAALIRNAWRTPYTPVFKTHVQEPQPQAQEPPVAEAQAECQEQAVAVLTAPAEENAAPAPRRAGNAVASLPASNPDQSRRAGTRPGELMASLDAAPAAADTPVASCIAESTAPVEAPAPAEEPAEQAESVQVVQPRRAGVAPPVARPRQEEEKGAYLF